MNIEHELQQALRRRQAPDGFAERVLARTHPNRAGLPAARSPIRNWLAAAAAVALLASGAARYYVYQQSVLEAERVNQDIRLALQITSEKLALVQARVEASLSDEQR